MMKVGVRLARGVGLSTISTRDTKIKLLRLCKSHIREYSIATFLASFTIHDSVICESLISDCLVTPL